MAKRQSWPHTKKATATAKKNQKSASAKNRAVKTPASKKKDVASQSKRATDLIFKTARAAAVKSLIREGKLPKGYVDRK